ncbi:biotin transporter BioY [Alteribacter keqinensis]|uniref:biotin transporter BioY n=1 Tax=Alteribacter keqinensis TaxID=2483800 RepID=UPI00160693E7|nr:biotin transporter BioY [Alteribacter keqinensis]
MFNDLSVLKKSGLCLLFALITGVFAQITIPLPYIPITGQTLAVGLAAVILGSKLGAATMVVYLLLGAVGLPVFSDLQSGVNVLVGPSGGYIFGFVLTAYVTGLILEKSSFTLGWATVANIVGMGITLAFGMVQLMIVLELTFTAALQAGVIPFLITGVIKAFLASAGGVWVRQFSGQKLKKEQLGKAS